MRAAGKALGFLGLGLLAVLLAIPPAGRSGDPGAAVRIDLRSLAGGQDRGAAPFARGGYRGSTCDALAGELGGRLDADFRRLPYRRADFDPDRAWVVHLRNLNQLFARLTRLRLTCDIDAFVGAVDRRLSPDFRANAFHFVTAVGVPRPTRNHGEWRAVLAAYLEEFDRLSQGA
jgi:hypothetical protein